MSESDGEMLQRLGIDGHAWASEYCKWFGEQYPDLETIHGWFANAIMAGSDHEGRKLAAREKRMREVAEQVNDAKRELMAFRNELGEEQPPNDRAIDWLADIIDSLVESSAKLLEGLVKEDAGT